MSHADSKCPCDGGISQTEGLRAAAASGAGASFLGLKISEVPPPGWILFGHLAAKGPKPSPTLIQVGGDLMNNLAREDFNRVGFLLLEQGFQCVSLDGPCYGFDRKPDEEEGFPGWRKRLEAGEDLIGDFNAKV